MASAPYIPLDWTNGFFNYPRMIKIQVMGDGSCYFNALVQGFSKIYITGKMTDPDTGQETILDRQAFVRGLRHELAEKLASPVNFPDGPIYYQTLSRGQLEKIAQNKGLEKYSLSALQNELRSGSPVDYVYHEFISNVLDKDIYILDLAKQDVYVIGDDFDILWKGRNSVVLLYDQYGIHFDLVGLQLNDGTLGTYFPANHSFIQAIRHRLREKIANGSNDPSNFKKTSSVNPVMINQAQPLQYNQNQPATNQPMPTQVNPVQFTQNQPNPVQFTQNQPNPVQFTQNQPNPVQFTQNQPMPNQLMANQFTQNQPMPNQPMPNQPMPNQPVPNQPMLTQYSSYQLTPNQYQPTTNNGTQVFQPQQMPTKAQMIYQQQTGINLPPSRSNDQYRESNQMTTGYATQNYGPASGGNNQGWSYNQTPNVYQNTATGQFN